MTVRFCPVCGRLNLADFRFCPYCGEAADRGPGLVEALKEPFGRLEAVGLLGRMDELGRRLDALESDMDEILDRVESGKD